MVLRSSNRFRVLLAAVLLAGPASVLGQSDEGAFSGQGFAGRFTAAFQRFGEIMDSVQDLGPWEEQYGYAISAAENVYAQNDWTSEADRFSLEVIREVGAIPPWQPQERFNRLSDLLTERYALSRGQTRVMQRLIAEQSRELFVRHMPTIMEYSLEAIETRAAGEAITPEQVARWTQLARPIVEDSHQQLQVAAAEFMEVLGPEQQALVRQDLAANNRRFEQVLAQSDRWIMGEWDATEWGLQNDPIQAAGEAKLIAAEMDAAGGVTGEEAGTASEQAAAQAAEPRQTPAGERRKQARPAQRPADRTPPSVARRGSDRRGTADGERTKKKLDEWGRYVVSFAKRYSLEDNQEKLAWRLHDQIVRLRDQVDRRHTQQTQAAESRFRNHPERLKVALGELETRKKQQYDVLFKNLKQRLDSVPTRAQREAVEGDAADGAQKAARDAS